MKKKISVLVNLVLPTVVLGALTGIIASIVINLFKYFAGRVIHLSEEVYGVLAEKPLYIPLALCAVAATAFLIAAVNKKLPEIAGGGIPISVAALRGLVKLRWLYDIVGVFFMSLLSFFVGVPLGNEGPSVQMGCAAGSGAARLGLGRNKAWERYTMTGGACAGFSVATGASVSGVVFAIEEAHRRISPMILASAASAVFFSSITTELIAPLLSVSPTLFPEITVRAMAVTDLDLALAIAVVMGSFAVAFLWLYSALRKLYNKKEAKVPACFKIFAVLAATVVLGSLSFNFVSTGHELVLTLLEGPLPIAALVAIVAVRSLLTLSANGNGITGGTFLPLLAIGMAVAALASRVFAAFAEIDGEAYMLIIVLGLVGCISAMMKMPLTAVVFAAEALGCIANLPYVILVALVSYMITEVFGAKSINDVMVEHKEEQFSENCSEITKIKAVVKENSFAVGREAADILWPYGTVITAIYRSGKGTILREGDVVALRCAVANKGSVPSEIEDILGKQSDKD